MPEPAATSRADSAGDLLVLRPRQDYYRTCHPVPADVLALVEVADTSHAHDRRKARLSAAAGIPEMWLFPERGRIDYLQGDVEVDMSAEDLFTHGTPKAAIAAGCCDGG